MRFAYSTLSIAICSALTSTVFAEMVQDSTQQPNTSVKLTTIVVEAAENNEVGTTIYTAEQLQNMPNGKKTIADFLRQNTNVQFSRDTLNAGNQASLAPEKISINGAQFYDNKFVVNGVNTSNTFDPVAETNDISFNGVSSQSQTANINTDLLCELEVIDSNASAEHGEFQGGVISAKTCAPKSKIGEIHGSVSMDFTSSKWSRFNFVNQIEELDSEELEYYSSDQYHREYDIYGLSASIYGNLNENWGLNLNTGLRQSIIPVLSGYSNQKIDTKENNNSLGLTAFYTPDENTKYQFGIDLFDYNRDGYISNSIHSDYTISTLTNTYFVQSEHILNNFKLENSLNYRTTDSLRELDQDYSASWIYADGDKDWGANATPTSTVMEGGIGGDLSNKQSSLSYDIKASLNPITLNTFQHSIQLGFGYRHNEGTWDRKSEHTSYTGSGYQREQNSITGAYQDRKDEFGNKIPSRGNLGDTVCAIGDALCSDTPFIYKLSNTDIQQWNGQYFKTGARYEAGTLTARQDQWSSFIQDEISWKNFKARLGLRADYDSLTSNLNIAPRTRLEYLPFNNNILRLTSGFNRYYGVTYLITELTEKANIYRNTITRGDTYNQSWSAENNYGWSSSPYEAGSNTKATDLNTPYNDETTFSVDGEVANLQWGLKWVNRDFHDAIRKNSLLKSFENVDGGEADTYTFNLRNIFPYHALKTQHSFNLGLSYVNDKTYSSTYKASDSANNDKWAFVDGEFYQIGSLPTKDSPFTARLNWLVQSPSSTWGWNNFLYYRSGSTNYVATKDKVPLNSDSSEKAIVYEEKDFTSKFTWDTRATYNWNLTPDQKIIFGLTVSNVLNKKNQAVTNTGTLYSEEGRRFIADVTFKF